jgi:hypothetical protein
VEFGGLGKHSGLVGGQLVTDTMETPAAPVSRVKVTDCA